MQSELPLILIVGPTAVGKIEIAIQLAERLNGEIVSADSRLFYRGMDIGTPKSTKEELARVPHHLIDIAGPHDLKQGLALERRYWADLIPHGDYKEGVKAWLEKRKQTFPDAS